MSLLFVDSFDHYVTADLLTKWTSFGGTTPVISAGTGRHGSASLQMSADRYVFKGLPASGATCVMGFAFKTTGTTTERLAGCCDGIQGKDQWYVQWNSDGSLAVYRGFVSPSMGAQNAGTLLATSAAGLVAANTYYYVEVKVVLHATTGTVTVRVNGAPVITAINQNTANGSVIWTSVFLSAVLGTGNNFDDVYVLDGSGAAPWNDFLGDVRVDPCFPTAAGATTAWTPSTGSNWQNVDDTAPNGDTDYNGSATAGQTDTFTTQDAPVSGATIYGVQHCLSMKKSDAGGCTVAPVIRHSGVDYPGADLAPSTVYAYGLQIAAVNPGTGAAWTEAGFNAAEFGYKRTT